MHLSKEQKRLRIMNSKNLEDENSVEYVNYLLTLNAIPNIIITIVYLLLGIVGNSFVIYVYAFATKSNINNKYFILVLAIIDNVACVVNCVFTIVLDTMQITFTSPIFCKLLRVACHVTTLTSAFVLMIIAIQRYFLVCRPFARQMTPPWRRYFVIISIALSFLLGFPAIVFYGPTKVTPIGFNVNGTSCKYEDDYVGSNGLAIYNAVFMLTCVSGIITICVLYAMVVKKIYKQRKKFSKNNRRSDSIKGIQITKEMSTTDSEIASDTRAMNSDSHSLDRSLKRKTSLSSFAKLTILSNKKKAKESLKYHRFSLMFITITIVCMISFMPLRTLEFLEVEDKDFVAKTFGTNMPLYRFLYTSYILNNIANPFIYGLFDNEFRNRLKNILLGK